MNARDIITKVEDGGRALCDVSMMMMSMMSRDVSVFQGDFVMKFSATEHRKFLLGLSILRCLVE
jgi:hypothetical protein